MGDAGVGAGGSRCFSAEEASRSRLPQPPPSLVCPAKGKGRVSDNKAHEEGEQAHERKGEVARSSKPHREETRVAQETHSPQVVEDLYSLKDRPSRPQGVVVEVVVDLHSPPSLLPSRQAEGPPSQGVAEEGMAEARAFLEEHQPFLPTRRRHRKGRRLPVGRERSSSL